MTKKQPSTQLKQKTFLANMRSTLGNISSSCIAANISRQTYYDWLKTDTDFKQAVEDIIEENVDFVESALMEQIKAGDITATIFFLKTRAKHRGYTEKLEQNITTEVKAEVKTEDAIIENLTDEEKQKIADILDDAAHRDYMRKHFGETPRQMNRRYLTA